MPLLNQSQAALLSGAHQTSISRALKIGNLEWATNEDGDRGIDSESPLFIAFVANVKASGPRRGPGRPKKSRLAPSPRPPNHATGAAEAPAGAPPQRPTPAQPIRRMRSDSRDLDRVGAREEEIVLKNKLLRTKLQRERAAVWRAARQTATTAAVRDAFGRLSATIEENFRSFADRHADALVAMSAAGAGRPEIADYLETEIGKAMSAVVSQCSTASESLAMEADDGLD